MTHDPPTPPPERPPPPASSVSGVSGNRAGFGGSSERSGERSDDRPGAGDPAYRVTSASAHGTDEERRDSPRAALSLRVEYRKLNSFFADFTKNISHGGTFISTAEPLPIGTVFMFNLLVPRLPGPIALRGQVVWVKLQGRPSPAGVPEDHEPGMGIRFMYDSPEQRPALHETVQQLMIESLGNHLYNKLMGRGT